MEVTMPTASGTTIGWFAGRLPDDWFSGTPEITYDRDEVLAVGTLPAPDLGPDADEVTRTAAARSRIDAFREETRAQRMAIADAAEAKFGRKLAWGVECGGERVIFTSLSVPVMTRLRMEERGVLDTLVDASVARSRSDALAWCVRLVGQHQEEWIASLREALVAVEKVRAEGPTN
jgi:hypothetical protein